MKKMSGAVVLGCLLSFQAWAVNQNVFNQSQITSVKTSYHAVSPQNGEIQIYTNDGKYYAVSLPSTNIENVSQMAHDIRGCENIVIRWEEVAGIPQRRRVTDFWMSIR